MLQEISSLSVEPCDGETLVVTVFEVEKSEVWRESIIELVSGSKIAQFS